MDARKTAPYVLAAVVAAAVARFIARRRRPAPVPDFPKSPSGRTPAPLSPGAASPTAPAAPPHSRKATS